MSIFQYYFIAVKAARGRCTRGASHPGAARGLDRVCLCIENLVDAIFSCPGFNVNVDACVSQVEPVRPALRVSFVSDEWPTRFIRHTVAQSQGAVTVGRSLNRSYRADGSGRQFSVWPERKRGQWVPARLL